MILRPRQQVFVDRCRQALTEHGAALGVAPTGAGKTVMFCAIAATYRRVLVLQHRIELVSQNATTFLRFRTDHSVGEITAHTKTWSREVLFAMVPTLANHVDRIPPRDLIIVDEAHHILAPTWRRVIDACRERNPDVKVLGVTATPNRGDKKGLRAIFPMVADQIQIGELIRSGHLVQPRAYVLDVGKTEELERVRKTSTGEYDMDEVGAVLGGQPVLDAVVDHWEQHAVDRQTVVFAATVKHAHEACERWKAAGYTAEVVSGETPDWQRAEIFDRLARADRSDLQVLVNVAVATEGWDCPPVSCVVLLRPSSYQSTVIQMIGRGLRTVDPTKHPGVPPKADCVVLDFGRSIRTHGGIEQLIDLAGQVFVGTGDAPTKTCPDCGGIIPLGCRECPLCGFAFPRSEDAPAIESFLLTPIDIIGGSQFRWVRANERTWVASGITASVVVFEARGQWNACGIKEDQEGSKLYAALLSGNEGLCLAAAEDFMRLHGDSKLAAKARHWLDEPASEKQLRALGMEGMIDLTLSRYEAACRLTLRFARSRIAKMYDLRKTA